MRARSASSPHWSRRYAARLGPSRWTPAPRRSCQLGSSQSPGSAARPTDAANHKRLAAARCSVTKRMVWVSFPSFEGEEESTALLRRLSSAFTRPCGQHLGGFGRLRPSPDATEGRPCRTATPSRMPTGTASRACCRDGPARPAGWPRTTASSSTPSCGGPRPASPGATCPNASATGTPSGSVSTAGPGRAPGGCCSRPCKTPTWSG